MSYHLAFDGGGNKLKAIVYDDELNILSYRKSGGINNNFYTADEVLNHVNESVSEALHEAGVKVSDACGVMVGSGGYLCQAVHEHSPDCTIEFLDEGYTYLLAAALTDKGVAAISGTGAAIYGSDGNSRHYSGGYGAYIGDEGSGYYIGEHGIRAALQYKDGWGEPTVLLDLLLEIDSNPSAYFYSMKNKIPLHMKIASFTHAVEKACGKDDKVALSIVKDAGNLLARQTIAFFRRYNLPTDSIIATCGGAWRTSPIMSEIFTSYVRSVYPDTVIVKPKFEPVVGAVIHRLKVFHSDVDNLWKLEENFKCL